MLTLTVDLKRTVGDYTGCLATFYHRIAHADSHCWYTLKFDPHRPKQSLISMKSDKWNIPRGCSCPSRAVLQMPWLPTWQYQSSTRRWLRWTSCMRWPLAQSSGWGFFLPNRKNINKSYLMGEKSGNRRCWQTGYLRVEIQLTIRHFLLDQKIQFSSLLLRLHCEM